jgi:hypothetical protein
MEGATSILGAFWGIWRISGQKRQVIRKLHWPGKVFGEWKFRNGLLRDTPQLMDQD